jgi:uncharacterized membrane-anchored protein YjiN (DUF445 family)
MAPKRSVKQATFDSHTTSRGRGMTANVIEGDKRADVARMKRMASGLFGLVTVIYLVASVAAERLPDIIAIGYVLAFAEAAMIGALADWFAVTALFRHPLGIPIPHTAIIPRRKDAIAQQFGHFVQSNFLTADVISEKVRTMQLSRRVADWLLTDDHSQMVAEQITSAVASAVTTMDDDQIQAMIARNVEGKIRDTSWSPLIGDLLSFITSGRRQQDVLDVAVNLGLFLLEDSSEMLKEKVGKETPWWFPDSVDSAIYNKIVRSVSKMLYDMQMDVLHPVRKRVLAMMDELLDKMKNSSDFLDKEQRIKDELLAQPAFIDFTSSLWTDIKASIMKQADDPHGGLTRAIAQSARGFAMSIHNDPELAGRIDARADDAARYLIDRYGTDVADLISNTIEKWDTDATADRIEAQVGRDLQFIRINGTVVGGLAGLVIHALHHVAVTIDG